MLIRGLLIIVFLSVLVSGAVCLADALVVTRAMKASTIAEIFVEPGEVRIELEVGAADIEAFKNLLPDELYERIAGESVPLQQRITVFLRDDWQMKADDHQLEAVVDEIELAKRIVRDEITGQPLPNQPDDVEVVLRAQWHYPIKSQPTSLSMHPPSGSNNFARANIGFVLYHRGVAVNDFRYLSQQETLRLDWNDSWYSEFDRKTLRRQYFAPAAAFVYIENFEVRKEIVFRPKDLQHWIDLGLAGQSVIKSDQRDAIRIKTAGFLAEHTPLEINGTPAKGSLDRVHFINRSLKTTGVVPPGSDIDIDKAMIGAIYVYPVQSLPDRVTMRWDLFNERIQQVPSVATDEAGGMPGYLPPDDPVLTWKNFLKNPTVPAFLDVQQPAPPAALRVSVITLILLAIASFIWFRGRPGDGIGTDGGSSRRQFLAVFQIHDPSGGSQCARRNRGRRSHRQSATQCLPCF